MKVLLCFLISFSALATSELSCDLEWGEYPEKYMRVNLYDNGNIDDVYLNLNPETDARLGYILDFCIKRDEYELCKDTTDDVELFFKRDELVIELYEKEGVLEGVFLCD